MENLYSNFNELCSSFIELLDEGKFIKSVDVREVSEFLDELSKVTTSKRLSLIPNVEEKFLKSFLILERIEDMSSVAVSLEKIFNSINTDTEFDYYNYSLSFGGLDDRES